MPIGNLRIETKEIHFATQDDIELINLTTEIREFITDTGINEGRITVFLPGSTGSIIATEFEDGLLEDTKNIIRKLIPQENGYHHDRIDNNAHSHLRASLMGSEMTIPIIKGRPTLGTWQQIVFADFDVRPRKRTIIMQIMGIE